MMIGVSAGFSCELFPFVIKSAVKCVAIGMDGMIKPIKRRIADETTKFLGVGIMLFRNMLDVINFEYRKNSSQKGGMKK